MKVFTLLFASCVVGTAAAFPSMQELQSAVSRRQFSGSTELLGDLATLGDVELSETGKKIKAILLARGDGQSVEGYVAPAFDSAECWQDECCAWKYIADELYGLMHDAATGTCNDFARASIRMGFHDAAAWNKASPYGGADGSLLLSDELSRPENIAMTGAGAKMKGIYAKYQSRRIGMADLLQLGAKVGVLACPGGPRIRVFVGRPDDATPAPRGLLPPASLTADQIIDLFAEKTVSAGGIVALIGAHTASRNHSSAGGPAAPPQDKTPGKWDTEYFDEHLRSNASTGVFRFPSDVSLARSTRTGPVYQQFSAQKGAWDEAYAREYIRMSLMGVKKINALRECTRALPKVVNKPKPPTSSKPPLPSGTYYKPTASSDVVVIVSSTSTVTVLSCPPEVTDCPYRTKTAPEVGHSAHGGDHVHTTNTAVAQGPSQMTPAATNKTAAVVTAGTSGRLLSAGWFTAAVAGFVAVLL